MTANLSRRHIMAAALLAASVGMGAVAMAQRRYPKRLTDAEIDAVFDRAVAEMKTKTAAFKAAWDGGDHWDVDLDAGLITFSGQPGAIIRAPVQVIGTRLAADSTWLWAWDHPSIPPARAAHARLVRAFGMTNGLEMLTTRKVVATEDQAWELTALAAHLAGAEGAYRGPSGKAAVFMTFGPTTIAKA